MTEMADNYISKLKGSSRNRESYDEIAELEAELRRAYVAKELQAQLLEQETERYIENVRKQQEANVIRLQQQLVLENDLCRRSENLKKSEDYRRQLVKQITQKEEETNVRKEEARKEREVLMEVDRIREECEVIKAHEMKNELAERTRKERLIFEEMKAIRRSEDEETELRKRFEDEIYLEDIEQRTKKAKDMREDQIQRRERAMNEIANIMINIEARKREKEILISELLAEDVKCEMLMKEEEEAVKKRKMREELAAGLKEQIIFTEQCKLRFIEQDRAFAEEIMKRVMEDEKTRRLTAEARRRMQVQYREDLNRLIEERRKIREGEMLKMEEAAREETHRLKMNLDRIREERKRLLKKHATNVADFLNKNVLTDEERSIITKM